jgi:hypothetical protein
MINDIQSLTTSQLRKVLAIKEQIEQLQAELASIAGGAALPQETERKGGMSAAGRARVAAAARARWARLRGEKGATNGAAATTDRRRSPEVRAKLAAAARLRWKRAKAAGKKAL